MPRTPTDPAMRVTVTGTGTPTPRPDRAGAGVLVEASGVRLQVDVGRSTSMRLAALGVGPADLDRVFLTHHHSDHVSGLPDLAMSRWIVPHERRGTPLPVSAPEGPSAEFARAMLTPFAADLAVRRSHTGRDTTTYVDVEAFEATDDVRVVWSHQDVVVRSVLVDHGPVEPSVAYRIDSGGRSVVVSGDCRPCEGVRALAADADVLVHEAMLGEVVAAGPYAPIGDYHTDCRELGAMARTLQVRHLLLTHLIPQPKTLDEARRFDDATRAGGYTGRLDVADDLFSVDLPHLPPSPPTDGSP